MILLQRTLFQQITFYCLVFAMTLLSLPALGDETQELARLLADRNTFVSNFQQISLHTSGERKQEQTGRMLISRPHRFRWEVLAPVPQLVVSDGEQVYIYDELLEQVTISPLERDKLDTPALLLSGDTSAISGNFSVTRLDYGDTQEFILEPTASDNIFEKLVLRFDNKRLSELEMADSFGQKSVIVFLDNQINTPVNDAEFQFTIPDGVDIFRNE